MRAQLTVIEVGSSEKLSGGATKLSFIAQNGEGKDIPCITFKPNILAEVKPGAILDVDYDELPYTMRNGDPYTVYKVWGLYKEDGQSQNEKLAQSGTWREEKAAEIIANLWIAGQLKAKDKLKTRLLKWLEGSMPE